MNMIEKSRLEHCLKSAALLDIWLRLTICNISNDEFTYMIDNGSEATLTIWFTQSGVMIKGFDHENSLNQFAADEWKDNDGGKAYLLG